MINFIDIDHVDKVYPLENGDRYIALKNIDFCIQQGEFVSLIGHSGCGKSTLLNIIAGLDRATSGGVILEGREIKQPGPDRMVVFQNYSLLPWKTVRQNIALAVNAALKDKPQAERDALIEEHIRLVGLTAAADKRPGELSGGMKQRVAIARALALRPKVLLLDEPFGALDALTRGNLQEQLMRICNEHQLTCVMVTHDVDEALLLSDRIVMLTNGPAAQIGQILDVPIPRPRQRLEVVNHPSYYSLRNEMIYFLNQQKRVARRKQQVAPKVAVSGQGLEKVSLDIGFIPLTDCAPLVVAKEKGLFQKYGLEQVNLIRQPSWKAIAQDTLSGRLDAAQMVAGMPLALTLGIHNATPLPVVTALTLSRNGNAITFAKRFYDQGIRSLTDFKQYLEQTPDKRHTLGMVHPASMHNLILRYWLAAADIDPDVDVDLTVIPPAQMFANLKAGNIDGYCVGEPWNSRAVQEGIGFVMATDLDIWNGHCEKVLGVRESWANENPQTHLALVKALLEACEYCDDRRNREDILQLLARPEYVGTDPAWMRPGFIDAYHTGTAAEPQKLINYNQFFVNKTNCPDPVEGLWMLTQLARWGIVPFPRNWSEILQRVRRVDVFDQAIRDLGEPHLLRDRTPIRLVDGTVFNPDDPLQYLHSLAIKRDYNVQEINIDVAQEVAA